MERLAALKGSQGSELALMARLHLLQGVVAYHLGRDREARLLLEEVATELQLLAVDEASLGDRDRSPQDVSPRLVQQRPSPGGSIQQLGVAAPPSYPTSTMVRTQRCGLAVPEVTITSSDSASTSVVDSEAPLINSTSNTTASSKATLSLDMRELKRNLRKQKGKLKKTNSIYKAAPADVEAADPDSSTSSSCGRGSVKSVKSAVVRQVASVAGNKDNFTYLAATSSLQPAVEEASTGENVTAEENDTDIDITKFLKSPEPSWTKGRGVTETKGAVSIDYKSY